MSESLPKPNRFSQMMQGTSPVTRLSVESQQFEQERMKWMLTRLKLKHHLSRIARLNQDNTGQYELRFSAFNAYFTTFPFVIGCSTLKGITVPWASKEEGNPRRTSYDYHVHTDPYSTEPSRFKKFSWVPFVAAYKDFFTATSALDRMRKVALVFPRKGFLHGMVIHNDDLEQYWTEGLMWVYKFPTTGRKLYVQPLGTLVEAIYANGHGWRPPGEA